MIGAGAGTVRRGAATVRGLAGAGAGVALTASGSGFAFGAAAGTVISTGAGPLGLAGVAEAPATAVGW